MVASTIKPVCGSFANALSTAKKASFFIYFADGTKTDCLVLLDMELRTESVIIMDEDGFRCFVWYDKVTSAGCQLPRPPLGSGLPHEICETTELRMYLNDGMEITLDFLA